MSKGLKKIMSGVIIVCFAFMLLPVESFAAAPTVKIVASPNKTDVYIGSDPIILTAQASGKDLKYVWTLKGQGNLDNTTLSSIFYSPPSSGSEKSQAIVTVTVTDNAGQTTTESLTFNILPAKQTDKGDVNNSKEGMSGKTKALLGVGALAAAGGVAAIVAGGGDDDNNDENSSFSGIFRHEFTKTANDGVTQIHIVNTYRLAQNGNSISGTYESVDTFVNQCTAGLNVSVTGTASGKTAILTWGYGENTCVGSNGNNWTIYTPGGTYNAELRDGGKTLYVVDFDSLSRMKRDSNMESSTDGEGIFTRQ